MRCVFAGLFAVSLPVIAWEASYYSNPGSESSIFKGTEVEDILYGRYKIDDVRGWGGAIIVMPAFDFSGHVDLFPVRVQKVISSIETGERELSEEEISENITFFGSIDRAMLPIKVVEY